MYICVILKEKNAFFSLYGHFPGRSMGQGVADSTTPEAGGIDRQKLTLDQVSLYQLLTVHRVEELERQALVRVPAEELLPTVGPSAQVDDVSSHAGGRRFAAVIGGEAP